MRSLVVLLFLLCLPLMAAAPPAVQPSNGFRPAGVGKPLGSVELRVPDTKADAFLHDLADFADTYALQVAGEPSGMVLDGRDVLLVWFIRPDGLAVLITDATTAERMQAFFYVAPGGFRATEIVDVMHGYRNKMSGYPAYGRP